MKKGQESKEGLREKFIRGAHPVWNAGYYGYTVKCVALDGRLIIKWTNPRRQQWTLADSSGSPKPDTPDTRRELTELAMRDVLEWQTGRSKASPANASSLPSEQAAHAKELTIGEVFLTYMRDKWPGIPDGACSWGRTQIRAFYQLKGEAERELVPDEDYLLSLVQAIRRITAFEEFSWERPIRELKRRHWRQYTFWRLVQVRTPAGKAYSPTTVATDYTRFHSAIRWCQAEHDDRWGDLNDPLFAAKVRRTSTPPPEVTPAQITEIIRVLREGLPGSWRGFAAVMLAAESGRRIGAIGADRNSAHVDGLRATDFSIKEGRWYVTWRAAAAKGKNYGRGDVTLPATRGMIRVLRWLRRFHPNPQGPSGPLLWRRDDPSRPVTYASLNGHFKRAWKIAFGKVCPEGLAFHGFCRSVITTIGTKAHIAAAAEWAGRTPQTAADYLRTRPEHGDSAAQLMDDVGGYPGRNVRKKVADTPVSVQNPTA